MGRFRRAASRRRFSQSLVGRNRETCLRGGVVAERERVAQGERNCVALMLDIVNPPLEREVLNRDLFFCTVFL